MGGTRPGHKTTTEVPQAQLALPDHSLQLAKGSFSPTLRDVATTNRRRPIVASLLAVASCVEQTALIVVVHPLQAAQATLNNVTTLIVREFCLSFATPLLSQHTLAVVLRHAPRRNRIAETEADAEERRLTATEE